MTKSFFNKLIHIVIAATLISLPSVHAQDQLKSATTIDGDG